MLPPPILPKAQARKLIRIIAVTLNTVKYTLDNGATTSRKRPGSIPILKIIGKLIKWALKKVETATLARPYIKTLS